LYQTQKGCPYAHDEKHLSEKGRKAQTQTVKTTKPRAKETTKQITPKAEGGGKGASKAKTKGRGKVRRPRRITPRAHLDLHGLLQTTKEQHRIGNLTNLLAANGWQEIAPHLGSLVNRQEDGVPKAG